MGTYAILPGRGRGTARSAVEGARALTQGCIRRITPSVSRCAAATSPQAGRI
ncbi:hypothetical protein HNQ99_001829 [Rhizorhapis suberifaciens]|uniref:Uncharacterized protein n=1 Tax=Rhizorhapis suberifaciens TaxID=13656 RepID=A0A840HVC0_9SPHN|nr:hypothetical protein [Rhizorhapis suberifaciens]